MQHVADPVRIDAIRQALCLVIDPEIGGNLVDLGLIYEISVGADDIARIVMTTTTPGCPASGLLREAVRMRAESVAGIVGAEVELTYDPPWSPERMAAVI